LSTSEQVKPIELSQVLTPVLSDRFVARWPHVIMTATFAVVFLLMSYLPLSHLETWKHLSEGRWILSHRSLPVAAPGLSLAEGIPYQDHAWLSQVIWASVHHWCGIEGLSVFNALIYFAVTVLFALTAFQLCRSKAIAMSAMLVSLLVIWPELNILRATGFALLMFAFLMTAIVNIKTRYRNVPRAWHGFVLCGIMLVWANLDASFLVGILILGATSIGRCLDRLIRKRSLARVLDDQISRRWIWIFELAIAATLINPAGVAVYSKLFDASNLSVLSSLGGLRPLNPMSWSGAAFVLLTALTIFVLRMSRQRLPMARVLLLTLGSSAVLFNQSLIVFYAPAALLCLMPSVRDMLRRSGGLRTRSEASSKQANNETPHQAHKFALSLICLLLVWIGFSLSPVSRPFLGGQARSADQLFDGETPLGVAAFLRDCDDGSLVWAPSYWGDWIHWTQGSRIDLFADSNARFLPQQVRHDYGLIFRGESSFFGTLDRYQVDLLVADKARQKDLLERASSGGSKWTLVYEDEKAAVFARRDASIDARRARS
jgi:hypothetical protein